MYPSIDILGALCDKLELIDIINLFNVNSFFGQNINIEIFIYKFAEIFNVCKNREIICNMISKNNRIMPYINKFMAYRTNMVLYCAIMRNDICTIVGMRPYLNILVYNQEFHKILMKYGSCDVLRYFINDFTDINFNYYGLLYAAECGYNDKITIIKKKYGSTDTDPDHCIFDLAAKMVTTKR